MRMLLEQRRQAMLQRHLSDKNCITHEDASYIKYLTVYDMPVRTLSDMFSMISQKMQTT